LALFRLIIAENLKFRRHRDNKAFHPRPKSQSGASL
jgi:hypothetical protein